MLMAACLKNNRGAAAAPLSPHQIFQCTFKQKKSDAEDEVIAQSAEKWVINAILPSRESRKKPVSRCDQRLAGAVSATGSLPLFYGPSGTLGSQRVDSWRVAANTAKSTKDGGLQVFIFNLAATVFFFYIVRAVLLPLSGMSLAK